LKRQGPFVVLWDKARTSGRRVRGMSGVQMVSVLFRMAFFPKLLKKRASVDKVWYDSNRESDNQSSSIGVKLSNTILLLMMLFIFTGPIWLIPWPEWVFDGPLGTFRDASYIFGIHFGLILWPCAYFLVRILLKQKRLVEQLKLIALAAVCLWLAWG